MAFWGNIFVDVKCVVVVIFDGKQAKYFCMKKDAIW